MKETGKAETGWMKKCVIYVLRNNYISMLNYFTHPVAPTKLMRRLPASHVHVQLLHLFGATGTAPVFRNCPKFNAVINLKYNKAL